MDLELSTIRPAIPSDAQALPSVLLELGYDVSAEVLELRLKAFSNLKTDTVFVAERGSRIIGCIHVGLRNSLVSEVKAEIHVLVVTESERGTGTGRRLIDEAARWAKEHGIHKLRLGTRVQRAGAHAFYEHLGFELIKEHRIYELKII